MIAFGDSVVVIVGPFSPLFGVVMMVGQFSPLFGDGDVVMVGHFTIIW